MKKKVNLNIENTTLFCKKKNIGAKSIKHKSYRMKNWSKYQPHRHKSHQQQKIHRDIARASFQIRWTDARQT